MKPPIKKETPSDSKHKKFSKTGYRKQKSIMPNKSLKLRVRSYMPLSKKLNKKS